MSLFQLILALIPVFFSIVLHEVAHGYAALKCGDDTAKRNGRLSLNPLVHVDKFGTIFLPLMLLWAGAPFLFGWAKPVPVNFNRLKNRRRDMVIVASAGIVVNMI
ncbi:MAG: site-2 protease family protein, partial [Alphaproteobacteria bacterium]|nr:site-2 protease family protein [Alphaproteobacteria bacterium]